MNKWFRSKNDNRSVCKMLKKCNKPLRCDNLQNIWNKVAKAGSAFLAANGTRRGNTSASV